MSFADYTAFKEALLGWADNADAEPRLDDFISLAHTRLNRQVRLEENSELAYYQTTVGSPWVVKPQLYSGMRRFKVNGTLDDLGELNPNVTGTQTWALTYQPLTRIDDCPGANALGAPKWYAVMSDRFRLAPIPNAVFQVEVLYWQTVPTLTTLVPTNAFLEQCDDLLLYAALIEADLFLKNPERALQWKQAYEIGLSNLNDDTQDTMFPDGDIAVRAV